MAHTLLTGITGSGKTFTGKRLCRHLHLAGKRTAVLDPIGSRWETGFQTYDPDEFLDYARRADDVHLFIDECGDVFRSGDDRRVADFHWLTTRARHLGHGAFLMAQRAVQVPATMRGQCETLYLFTSSTPDGKVLAVEFNKPHLQECALLAKGEFFLCDRYSYNERGAIDFQNGKCWHRNYHRS